MQEDGLLSYYSGGEICVCELLKHTEPSRLLTSKNMLLKMYPEYLAFIEDHKFCQYVCHIIKSSILPPSNRQHGEYECPYV